MAKIFLSVLNMSITGAFVIAAVCLARLLLKKAPKIISYCLWAVVAFRLIFPFSIESVLSLMPFKAAPIPTDIAMQPVPRIDSGISFVNNAVSRVLPAATPNASVNPLQIWTAIGGYIWFFGVAIMFIYGVTSYILLKRKIRVAVHVETNIYEADNIKSPFVLGIIKPKIYMPVGLSEKEREYILLHEQTHIKRRDYIVKFAAYFIFCLHWFNPLAWAAFLLMGIDMEMSCDERVLKNMGGDTKIDYSRSLLSLATERRIIGGSPLAFGEGGVKQRIKNALNFKKPSRVIVLCAVALVAVLSAGFAVNRVINAPLIEMKMVYEENPAYFLKDMKLVWDDTDYFVTRISNAKRGKEIGYAVDELSTWRIYELKGYGRDYLYAVESKDVWRVMSVYPPEKPSRQYILENASDEDRLVKMLSVTLYNDGTARLATPLISSYAMLAPCYYTFADDKLLIHYERDNVIAIFEIVDDNTILFKEASTPLYAEKGARYVAATVDSELTEKIHQYLDIIMSSPMLSSNSGDYIREHQTEYDAILEMGITALPVLTDILNGGDRGLRGVIASGLVNDIIERESNKPHSEVIESILIDAGFDLARWSKGFSTAPTDDNIIPLDILDKIYLGMPSADVYHLFGEPDYQASGLMWFGYNNVGTFDVMGSFDQNRTDTITRFQNSTVNWNMDELIGTAVMQRYADNISAGEYPAEWHQIISMDASANEFTIKGIAQYEVYVPDGEYGVNRIKWEYADIKMTFTKNAYYNYELTSCSIKDGVWVMGVAPMFKRYDEAMYHFVGAIPSSGRFGIGAGTAVITDYAESLTPDGEFLIKYFPGATLSIEGIVTGNWIITYEDSGKNIAVGKDGTGEIVITDDLIGIYSVDDGKHNIKFEKYIKNK